MIKKRLSLVLESFNKYIDFYNNKPLKKVKSLIKKFENKQLKM